MDTRKLTLALPPLYSLLKCAVLNFAAYPRLAHRLPRFSASSPRPPLPPYKRFGIRWHQLLHGIVKSTSVVGKTRTNMQSSSQLSTMSSTAAFFD